MSGAAASDVGLVDDDATCHDENGPPKSTVEMIRYAIADDGITLSLNNKGMYNHVADFCERWNEVVDICNGRRGPHSPANATQRQTMSP